MDARKRPLSPHLQIYRWQLTMAMSIAHRASGVALAVGSLLLVCWLAAAASGPDAFATVQSLIGSFIGYIALFGWSVALFYHLCNGIRHLFWDAGKGFDLASVDKVSMLVLAATGGLTVLVWLAGLIAK